MDMNAEKELGLGKFFCANKSFPSLGILVFTLASG